MFCSNNAHKFLDPPLSTRIHKQMIIIIIMIMIIHIIKHTLKVGNHCHAMAAEAALLGCCLVLGLNKRGVFCLLGCLGECVIVCAL